GVLYDCMLVQSYTAVLACATRHCLPSTILFYCHVAATPDVYTLSLHDALPIYLRMPLHRLGEQQTALDVLAERSDHVDEVRVRRSEEHTSELQSHLNLVCRLLLEKKKDVGDSLVTVEAVLDGRQWGGGDDVRAW